MFLNNHLKLVCSPLLLVSHPLLCPFDFPSSLSLPRLHRASGSAMNVVYGEEEMKRFLEEAAHVSQVSSLLTVCTYLHLQKRHIAIKLSNVSPLLFFFLLVPLSLSSTYNHINFAQSCPFAFN